MACHVRLRRRGVGGEAVDDKLVYQKRIALRKRDRRRTERRDAAWRQVARKRDPAAQRHCAVEELRMAADDER